MIVTRMMKTSLRLALASTILGGGAVITAAPAVAQTTISSVSGSVSDASGAAVSGASVVAVNTGTNQTFRATTDANGFYQINGLRPGPYHITVTGPDGTTFNQDVDAAIGQSASLDVTLGAAPAASAGSGTDIVVTGNRLT
ncbi:MAG: carboxypeptidase-like regulatory domain-containing protein, partial [Sphingomonas sp.]